MATIRIRKETYDSLNQIAGQLRVERGHPVSIQDVIWDLLKKEGSKVTDKEARDSKKSLKQHSSRRRRTTEKILGPVRMRTRLLGITRNDVSREVRAVRKTRHTQEIEGKVGEALVLNEKLRRKAPEESLADVINRPTRRRSILELAGALTPSKARALRFNVRQLRLASKRRVDSTIHGART